MDSRRAQLTPGYVLHQRPYGETGAIVEAFSREYGRIGLVARGVRGGRSRRQGALQPFAELLLSWSGRGELPSLTGVEPTEHGRWLTGTRLISGFYLNELMMRLLKRDDPHPEVYDDYARAIAELAAGRDEAWVLRIFEKRLLDGLGYGMVLDHDIAGMPLDPQGHYRYLPEYGPERALPGGHAIPARALLALAAESDEVRDYPRETRRLLHDALAPHLGERPLRSRELYRQFMRASAPSGGNP